MIDEYLEMYEQAASTVPSNPFSYPPKIRPGIFHLIYKKTVIKMNIQRNDCFRPTLKSKKPFNPSDKDDD